MAFSENEMKERAFHRAACALYSFWEEQKGNSPRVAAVHSRLFETLIYNKFIEINRKAKGRSYPEHVVPCAYIRDLAFEMYWNDKTIDNVATMIKRLLKIAYITTEQAKQIDSKYKYTMPLNWNPETDNVLIRLELFNVPIIEPIELS